MKKVAAKAGVVYGIDVSFYQPKIDWIKVKSQNIEFAFLRATEGRWTDRCFNAHRMLARDAGLATGAYHFFHPNIDVAVQAEHFLNVVGDINDNDLPPVLDWEVTDNVPSALDFAAAMTFLNKVESSTGRRPIIYTGPYFMREMGLYPDLKKYPLWIAHYGTSAPLVPEPWTEWTFWQTGYHEVEGINGPCDYDQFNGSVDELKSFIAASRLR